MIKIDMQEPLSCDKCRFGVADKSKPSVWCSAMQRLVNGAEFINSKLKDCPLKGE